MTAYSIAQLLREKKSTCRHCQAHFPIDPKVMRDIERTLHSMADYVDKKDAIADSFPDPFAEPPQETPPEQPLKKTSEEQQPGGGNTSSNQTSTNTPDAPHTPAKHHRRSKRKNRQPSMANG